MTKGPAALTVLVLALFWKLAFSGEFVWFDHPDMCYLEIPRLQFQARELHQGHFPLWDPSIWAGQSLIGQTQPGPLFPLNLAFLLLPLEQGYLQAVFLNWYWVVLHLVAAFGCYALCREWGRSRQAAILAGIGFGCGGFLGTVAWLDVAAGAIFTPWILLFLTRAVEQPRKPLANAAVSGLLLGIAWLSGHHEIPLLVTLLVACIWAATRWRLGFVALLVSGLIASLQVLPTIEFGRLSKRWIGVTEPVGWNDPIPYSIATVYSMPARGVLETVLPSANRYADCAPFLGLAIVAMAVLGLAKSEERGRVKWIGVAAAVALLFALGAATPLHGTLYSLLPGLGKARVPVRAIHIFDLGLCLLAAYGLDVMLAQKTGRAMFWSLLGFGACVVFWAIGHPELDDRLLLSGLLAIALAASLRLRPLAVVWIIAAMIEMHGVSTATYSSKFRTDQNKFTRQLENYRDVGEFLRELDRREVVRVDVNDNDVSLNFGDYFGVDSLGGYVAGVPENLINAETHTERMKTILAATHYLSREPARSGQESYLEGKSGVKVFRNPESRPRTWSVHQAIRAATREELKKPIDPHQAALLVGEVPELESCTGDEVKIVSRSPNRVRIDATMRCNGMVILADSYYPGWQVLVDGREERLWEAYGVVRGVVVPGGNHQVEFRFRPRSFYTGLVLFAAGLVLTAALVSLRR